MIDHSFDWIIDWKIDRLIDWMIDWKSSRSVGHLNLFHYFYFSGSSGDIVIEKSVVFAAAEVFFCILIRKFPSLNPALKSVSAHVGSNQTAYIQLASSTIETMPQLLSLCSHRGTLALLPVILHILLTSLRQLVEDDVHPSDPRCMALIQCLRTLCSSPYVASPAVGKEWEEILRSAFLRLTDFVKTLKDQHQEANVSKTEIFSSVNVFDRLIDWLIVRLMYWLMDMSIDSLIDLLIDRLIVRLIDWLFDWLVVRLIGWLDMYQFVCVLIFFCLWMLMTDLHSLGLIFCIFTMPFFLLC